MKRYSFHINAICLVVIITIFSQITTISSVFRPAMYAGWLVLAGMGIVSNSFRLKFSNYTIQYGLLFFLFYFYCFVCSLFGTEHLNSGYLNILPIPLLVMFVANSFGKEFDEESIRKIASAYTIAVFIFALWVHITFFASYSSWLSFTGGYLFETKNSASQTISPAIFMIFFIINSGERAKKRNVLWYVIAAYLIIVLGLCQARTSLLGLAACLVVYAVRYSKKQLQWISILLIVSLVALQIPTIQVFIEKVFSVSKYAGADLNTISSGRVNGYIKAFAAFIEKPIIGQGSWYIDNAYLSVLTESGLIGFVIIETMWISRILTNYRSNLLNSQIIGRDMRSFVLLLTVFYFIESIFEAYPPFGPGVTSFAFWFMCEAISSLGANNMAKALSK